MQIPRGFEMMAQSIIKMLGLDPAKVMAAIDGMHGALQSVAADLRDIRADQKLIKAHLGIAEEPKHEQLGHAGHESGSGSQAGGNA